MKNLSKDEKLFLAFYSGWALLHLVFLAMGWKGDHHSDGFWPFGNESSWDGDNKITRIYDLSEFLVYVGTPAVAFFIYRVVNSDGKK